MPAPDAHHLATQKTNEHARNPRRYKRYLQLLPIVYVQVRSDASPQDCQGVA